MNRRERMQEPSGAHGKPVYIVLIGSEEKVSQTDPTILRFRNEKHLKDWLKKGGKDALERWKSVQGDCFGGWPNWHEVSHRTAYDADKWLEDKKEAYGE